MERNIRKLRLMVAMGLINLEWFYTVTVYDNSIIIQGKYEAEKALNLARIGFDLDVKNPNGYVKGSRDGITIVLT